MDNFCVQRFIHVLITLFSWTLTFVFMGYAILTGYLTYDEYIYCGLEHVWIISMFVSGMTTSQMIVNSCLIMENTRIINVPLSNVYKCKCISYVSAIIINIVCIVLVMCQLGTYPTKCHLYSNDPLYMLMFVTVFLDIVYISLYGLQLTTLYRYDNTMTIRLYNEPESVL